MAEPRRCDTIVYAGAERKECSRRIHNQGPLHWSAISMRILLKVHPNCISAELPHLRRSPVFHEAFPALRAGLTSQHASGAGSIYPSDPLLQSRSFLLNASRIVPATVILDIQ